MTPEKIETVANRFRNILSRFITILNPFLDAQKDGSSHKTSKSTSHNRQLSIEPTQDNTSLGNHQEIDLQSTNVEANDIEHFGFYNSDNTEAIEQSVEPDVLEEEEDFLERRLAIPIPFEIDLYFRNIEAFIGYQNDPENYPFEFFTNDYTFNYVRTISALTGNEHGDFKDNYVPIFYRHSFYDKEAQTWVLKSDIPKADSIKIIGDIFNPIFERKLNELLLGQRRYRYYLASNPEVPLSFYLARNPNVSNMSDENLEKIQSITTQGYRAMLHGKIQKDNDRLNRLKLASLKWHVILMYCSFKGYDKNLEKMKLNSIVEYCKKEIKFYLSGDRIVDSKDRLLTVDQFEDCFEDKREIPFNTKEKSTKNSIKFVPVMPKLMNLKVEQTSKTPTSFLNSKETKVFRTMCLPPINAEVLSVKRATVKDGKTKKKTKKNK